MKRWAPIIVIVSLLLIIQIPFAQSGPGSRVMDLSISEIRIEAAQSSSGSYPVGNLDINLGLENTGTETILGEIPLTYSIEYSNNQTVILNGSHSEIVVILPGQGVDFLLFSYYSTEDGFTIKVNGTFGNSEFFKQVTFFCKDYDDMSCTSSNFIPGSHHFKYSSFIPELTVVYSTNTVNWFDRLDVRMVATSYENGIVEVYNETTYYFKEPGSGPGGIYTGETFEFTFPEWNSTTTGRHLVRFEVLYDDQNMTNNIIDIDLYLDIGPTIEGYVKDTMGEPIENVHVELIKGGSVENNTMTDENGSYMFGDVPLGMYTIEFGKDFYRSESVNITIDDMEISSMNMTLTALVGGGVRGTVTDDQLIPVVGAIIYLESEKGSIFTTTTDENGEYRLFPVPIGPYLVWTFEDLYGSTEKEMEAIHHHKWSSHDFMFHDYLISIVFDPVDGKQDASLDEVIIATFSESMDTSSFMETNIIFRESGSEETLWIHFGIYPIDPTAAVNSTLAIFPYYLLNYNTTYELVLGKNITSERGIPLGRNVTLTFQTIPFLPDLEITSFYPSPDSMNAPSDVTIFVGFSEPLNETTLNSDTISLTDSRGIQVLIDISYSEMDRTLRIQPMVDLLPGEYYIVYLSSEIKTTIPNYKVPITTWSFQVAKSIGLGSLTGRLVNEDGDPFDPSQVDIRMTQGNTRLRIVQVQTTGDFHVIDLEDGIWTISFNVFGYEEYKVNELVEKNQTLEMGTVTLYEDDTVTTVKNDFDYQFLGGACCIMILLILIIILFVSNRKLRTTKDKNTKLVDKLERLLETHHEE